jgi:hypothetical protein
MIDIYVMIWHLKFLNLKTSLRPSIVGGMPLKRTHVFLVLTLSALPGHIS